MGWNIVFINDKDEKLTINFSFGSLGDAAGDLNGGDALNALIEKYGTVTIKEIRIVPKKPVTYESEEDRRAIKPGDYYTVAVFNERSLRGHLKSTGFSEAPTLEEAIALAKSRLRKQKAGTEASIDRKRKVGGFSQHVCGVGTVTRTEDGYRESITRE